MADRSWGWRRETQAVRAHARPAGVRSSPGAAASWAQAQVTPWAARTSLTSADYAAGLEQINATNHDVFIFDIGGGDVRVREKQVHHPWSLNRRVERFRVHLFRDHLRMAMARAQLSRPFALGLVVGDLVRGVSPDLPIFAYQKAIHEPWLLVPDVEMLEFDFYDHEDHDTPGVEKINRIVFSGSSTGGMLDEEAVLNNATPRLGYAARFVDSSDVQFTIGAATECLSPEAEAALRAKPYFRHVTWVEQLTHRYIMSLDGNGATCSRVIRTLRSRSCLVKQRSDHVLFYFAGLLPWSHYIPVENAEELERLAPMLTRPDFPSEGVCDAANAFCAEHLNRRAVVDYTAALLRGFEAEYLRRI